MSILEKKKKQWDETWAENVWSSLWKTLSGPDQFRAYIWRAPWFHTRWCTYSREEGACVRAQLCLTLCDPMAYTWPTRLLCPWDFPGKNTGVGCCFLLQGIFPTQGLNLPLLHLLLGSRSCAPLLRWRRHCVGRGVCREHKWWSAAESSGERRLSQETRGTTGHGWLPSWGWARGAPVYRARRLHVFTH